MKHVFTNGEIPHLWANQTQEDARSTNKNLYFNGKTIYSYGAHFPIATFVENAKGERAVLMTTRSYSVTTQSHISQTRSACRHIKPVFNVPLTDRMIGYKPIDLDTHKGVLLDSYHERIKSATNKVARSKVNREYQLEVLTGLVTEANEFCDFFGLGKTITEYRNGVATERPSFSVPADFDAIRKELASKSTLLAADKRRRQKELKERYQETVNEWLVGGNVRITQLLDTVYLRIAANGTEVETSRGARIPISHARRGLTFIQGVRESGQEYRRNGHTLHLGSYAIDRVEVNGNLHAGCHHIKWTEIERFAPILNLHLAENKAASEVEERTAE